MNPELRRALDEGLRRVPGMSAAARLLAVRLETVKALLARRLDENPLPVPDAVTPSDIPSVAELGPGDRVLAELDQDGFAFALHPADVPFFNRRSEKMPRLRYRLHVVLRRGYVCVRKRFIGQPRNAPASAHLSALLGLFFYNEAAALLRLRDLPSVPRIRDLHLTTRTLFIDYVRGQTLQHQVAERGQKVLDIDLAPLGQLFDPERDRREIEAFASGGGEAYRGSIEEIVRSMNARGVAPLDVKLGNVLIGEKTGTLYWVDFERAAIEGAPRYREQLAEHHDLVNRWFGLSLPGDGGA
ncbi:MULTISPECIES: hypothetical protein [Sorangium]|uniref:Protein kinase domain-containing protein n=1 Tax=Sorangium cellulosum TaxID=56 RepID=A0A4P2QJX2_SORCE|nr:MULTISPECIES: hypothetical protein [Sorangium]AUX29733.1 hypothetical protein SOCE836_018250 [Sorangium cellulosum]WCQ89122.1 hypothetical protein NQZ70_01809 [Sorangium sp. Soce836]